MSDSAVEEADLAAILRSGLAHHGAGRLDDAYACYASVLERDPLNPDALHLAGAVRLSQGATGEGVARIWEAVGQLPVFPQAWNSLGLGLKAQGRLEPAIACLERAVEQAPEDAPLLCNLGGALWDAGRTGEATDALRRACALAPDMVEAQVALGRVALALGQGGEALACYNAALALQPGRLETLAGLGAALLLAGDPVAAEAMLRRAGAAAPDDPGIGTDLGRALQAQGRVDEAIAAFGAVLARLPDHLPARLHLGFALQARGEALAALDCFRAAVAAAPALPPAQMALAVALAGQGLWPEALASFDAAAALRPDDPAAHMGRASALQMLERRAEAAEACRAALALQPGLAEAHASLGVILQELGELEAAVASHRQALTLRPDLVDERCSLSHALRDLGALDEAAAQARIAVSQRPGKGFAHASLGFALLAQGHVDEAEASLRMAASLPAEGPEQRTSAGMIRLLLGDLPGGFADYEARWLRPSMAANPIRSAGPAWDGGQIAGRSILVYCEQGLGDSIQFLRFVPEVAARGGRVLLAVQPELAALAASVPGVAQICPLDQGVPAFDLHCPLVGLPLALGTTLDTLPAETPYLTVPANRLAAWADRLRPAPAPAGLGLFRRQGADRSRYLRVGLAWSGSRDHGNDRNRSLPLHRLAGVLAAPGCTFHVVQKDVREADMRALGQIEGLVDPRGLVGDLADTAAIMQQLDLVISVDTAPAHLAGALGRPVWVLLPAVPDWRWLLRRADSPWYPSARLFRQKQAGDWDGVLAEVAAALAELASARL
ncbi:MAG: hypothetical protein BGP12_20895 [Rhodospirillales bacterium 70-18]|nr:tetratricopeptide repeat protein [Rhodospirillales bacterium]OJY70221.1 MAG: hypothetical protein BGP12_20895 [Rhodospirillales bacterium 70-18]